MANEEWPVTPLVPSHYIVERRAGGQWKLSREQSPPSPGRGGDCSLRPKAQGRLSPLTFQAHSGFIRSQADT